MSAGDKKSYSEALVNCSVPQRMVSACPLAFGEAGIKGRIKNVLNYKKPAFWIIAAAVIVCIAVSLCFLTNPQKEVSPSVTVEIPTEVQYRVAGLLYNNGNFSYVEDEENAPQYYLYHEKLMWNQSVREESARQVWGVIGDLQSIDLTEENFDALFRNTEIWQENYTPELIRKSTASAKQTESEEGFFYILYQKSADVLLCRGFYMDDGTPFIRWVEKLEAVTNQDTNSSFSAPWQGNMLSAPDSNIQFDSLRDKYPQYYDLNTENGLAVYVCKMGENSYQCGLLPGTDCDRKYDEILQLAPASLEEVKEILNSYDISNENIVFIPFQNPLSSYAWVVMEEEEIYEEWLETESNYLRELVGRPIGD